MRLNLLWLAVLLAFAPAIRAAGPIPATAGDLHTWCRDVTRVIPQIKLDTCVADDLKPWARSVNGRQIMVREFAAEQRPAARVLVIGGIHGDELTSVSIVFRWIEQLKK